MEDITLAVSGKDRVTVQITSRNAQTGRLEFTVKGKSATPQDKPDGDTKIAAKIGDQVCASINAVVVIPKRIKQPYPQANGNVSPQNLVLDGSTSPAYWNLPANTVKLVTVWGHWLSITVADQFGNTLSDLYDGAPVQEDVSGSGIWRNINQALSAGIYEDPVGWMAAPDTSEVPAGGSAANAWPTEPTLTMQSNTFVQNIGVKVGGHKLSSNIRRRVTMTPPSNVQIQWPPP